MRGEESSSLCITLLFHIRFAFLNKYIEVNVPILPLGRFVKDLISVKEIPWHVKMETAYKGTFFKDLLLWLYRVFQLNVVPWSFQPTVHHTQPVCGCPHGVWAQCCPWPVARLPYPCHHQRVNSYSPASVKLQRI